MKIKFANYSLILILVFLFLFCSNIKKKPNLSLSKYTIDFNVKNRDSIYHDYLIVSNVGKAELNIENIQVGCGCTNAVISKRIISPNDTALLTITYNSRGKKGFQEEFVIIEANTDSIIHLIRVKAEIVKDN